MKTLKYYFAGLGFLLTSTSFGQDLVPDQNPNYKVSQDQYMAKKEELTSNQGVTAQNTYVAFDWTTHKADVKQERIDRKYELKKIRYQSRCRYGYNSGLYYGNSYGANNYSNFGNGYGYNNYNGFNGYNNYNSVNLPLWYSLGIYSLLF